jgi:hypothetical protein
LAQDNLRALPATLEPDHFLFHLDPEAAPAPVTVHLASPTRLVASSEVVRGAEPVPFSLLVARLLDRFGNLYGEGASPLLAPERRGKLSATAATVPLLADDTRWLAAADFSARSRQEMDLGGKVGCLTYGPPATTFLPLLKAGEILHIGKNAAAGCGRVVVV